MRRKFNLEFKQGAVSMVINDKVGVVKVAADLGIGKSTLENWVRLFRARSKDPEALSETELIELKRLRKEVQILRIERDLLKKTALYFAKDSQ